ncbi:hypothetical protein KI387_036317, partial [Taxus chinensis]
LEEEVEIEEPKEENVGDDDNYLEVKEVDGDTHNGLIEYIDDKDDDEEEAPSFSCVVFTHAQSKKGAPSSTAVVKENNKKENSSAKVPKIKIISRGSPPQPSMESDKEKRDPLVSRYHVVMS